MVLRILWLITLTRDKKTAIDTAKQLLELHNLELVAEHKQGHIVRVANTFVLIATASELANLAGITGWQTSVVFNAVKTVFNTWAKDFKYV